MGLNITPYDNDNTAAAGTTTLRHIDQQRPPRVVDVRQRAVRSVPLGPRDAARATRRRRASRRRRAAPKLAKPLDSANSPQTIAQSARNGVPISGRDPAPAARGITISGVDVAREGQLQSERERGRRRARVRAFLYDANPQRREQELHAGLEHEL